MAEERTNETEDESERCWFSLTGDNFNEKSYCEHKQNIDESHIIPK